MNDEEVAKLLADESERLTGHVQQLMKIAQHAQFSLTLPNTTDSFRLSVIEAVLGPLIGTVTSIATVSGAMMHMFASKGEDQTNEG